MKSYSVKFQTIHNQNIIPMIVEAESCVDALIKVNANFEVKTVRLIQQIAYPVEELGFKQDVDPLMAEAVKAAEDAEKRGKK